MPKYWQVEMDEQSSYLCMFNTPFRRYRFTRMLKSASKVFQKKNEEVFDGIDGIHIVADDIISAASTIGEHDHILQQVLHRAIECNFKLNFDTFRVGEVRCLGSVIIHQGVNPDPVRPLQRCQHPVTSQLFVACLA